MWKSLKKFCDPLIISFMLWRIVAWIRRTTYLLLVFAPSGQAAPQAAPAAAPAPAQPGGQPDYSAAWAEYYRQQAAYYGTGNPQAMGAAPQAPQVRHWSEPAFFILLGNVNVCTVTPAAFLPQVFAGLQWMQRQQHLKPNHTLFLSP